MDRYTGRPPKSPAEPNPVKILPPCHIFAGSFVRCTVGVAKNPDEMFVLVRTLQNE